MHVPPVPPAWRATQLAELGGHVQGAPPCLSSLTKVGRRTGQRAAWLLGSYRGSAEPALDLDVLLQLDRNPDEPCCKLLFVRSTALVDLSLPDPARRSKDRPRLEKVGHMLLACEEGESALRGLFVAEGLRGRGLSRLLLAVWLRLCAEGGVAPTTRMLTLTRTRTLSLSLSLSLSLGLTPGRHQDAQQAAALPLAAALRLHSTQHRAIRPGAAPSCRCALPYISLTSPLYLPCISPISPQVRPPVGSRSGGRRGPLLGTRRLLPRLWLGMLLLLPRLRPLRLWRRSRRGLLSCAPPSHRRETAPRSRPRSTRCQA